MSDSVTPAFHVMAKPTGARCNLRCDYCFFLEKSALYPGSDERMTDEVAEAFVRQTIEAQQVPFVTLAWQGGEPTLMGLDFLRRALEVERDALPEGWQVERTIQTNGTLLDDEWAAFLADNDILVGLSIDGPRELHNAYRHDVPVVPSSTRWRPRRAFSRSTGPSSTSCAPSTPQTPATRSRSTATSETSSGRASSSSYRSSR